MKVEVEISWSEENHNRVTVCDPGVSNSSAKMEVGHGWISLEPQVGFRAMKIIRHYLETSLAIP
jgi:hypothetical protein